VRVPAGAVKRLMKTFGKEADFERISGNFVIDAGKLRNLGWQPSVKTRDGIVAMMRA
jgi:UDP-glucose 4-epimerase